VHRQRRRFAAIRFERARPREGRHPHAALLGAAEEVAPRPGLGELPQILPPISFRERLGVDARPQLRTLVEAELRLEALQRSVEQTNE
jgi:hypothetical protein